MRDRPQRRSGPDARWHVSCCLDLQEAKNMKTSTVMTRDVVVVSPIVTAGIAARMMERLRIRHLPVVEKETVLGIVSLRDLTART